VANTASDYLDVHNGRFCKTPQYPNGTYCYFTTVDQNYNSTYPYVVGPYYYGVKSASNMNAPTVTPITETVLTYNPVLGNANFNFDQLNFKIYPNPAGELIIIQSSEMISENLKSDLVDEQGRIIASKEFFQGSTICYFETDTIYNGIYFLKIASNDTIKTYKVILKK
ncbi:MAG: T9SS type A sorting domain-containing protein, partial [Flavobacterium sp.]|nr:T9SS type A sorting domain-containing protein [Flavobacterium sp.]